MGHLHQYSHSRAKNVLCGLQRGLAIRIPTIPCLNPYRLLLFLPASVAFPLLPARIASFGNQSEWV